jgi:hypothetical protein
MGLTVVLRSCLGGCLMIKSKGDVSGGVKMYQNRRVKNAMDLARKMNLPDPVFRFRQMVFIH